MSEHLERVVAALERTSGVDELNAVARACERAEIQSDAAVVRRHATGAWVDAVVHRDIGRGRGSARLHVAAELADPAPLVAAAAARAAVAVGPAWRLPPPAAPARVQVADESLGPDLERAAEDLLEEARARFADLAGPGGPGVVPGAPASDIPADARVRSWRIAVERCRTDVHTSAGLVSGYDSTLLSVEAVLALQGHAERIRVHARRRQDLTLGRTLARALRRLRDRVRAEPLAAGRYDLVLAAAALAPAPAPTPEAPPDPADTLALAARLDVPAGFASIALEHLGAARLGWLGPFAAQADGALVRQGLTRYRPGQPVGDTSGRGDALTLASDGTIPYGLLSRPFGDLGEPVRRFLLVKEGVAAGLALDLREAALRGVTANGGVCNLVLAPGRTKPAALRAAAERPVIEVMDLAWLEVDPRTGELVAEIGLGYAAGGAPVTGGAFRGNLFDMLAAVRLSAQEARTAWYRGPEAVRFADLAIT